MMVIAQKFVERLEKPTENFAVITRHQRKIGPMDDMIWFISHEGALRQQFAPKVHFAQIDILPIPGLTDRTYCF